jgi:hypothetical protein
MSADPRGGIWYENTRQKKMLRLDTNNNGDVIESISLNSILGEGVNGYKPISVMQICRDRNNNPVMIISANNPGENCYVLAIDLVESDIDEKLLWKAKVQSLFDLNYAGGLYTILLDNNGNNPRIIFGAYWGGVYALGH